MRIGYGRVSTRDQNLDGQHDALGAAGASRSSSTAPAASSPAVPRSLLIARASDQLVVTKLDRLGRSLEHLIAQAMYDERGSDGQRAYTVQRIADEFGVTRPTIYRHLQRHAARASRRAPKLLCTWGQLPKHGA